ncbi:hypothetical protein LNQ03_04525 [Klebsiella pneumoniae subsp. pneumoniae]|nr:hypothetical protein [Klebsiella pneumoniae subsp. pneumoniae]
MLNTTRLVNNLLDMARIQSGGFNLHKEWLTLEEVVGSALRCSSQASAASIFSWIYPIPSSWCMSTDRCSSGC